MKRKVLKNFLVGNNKKIRTKKKKIKKREDKK